ncbi:MAG TPA: hypothetical protein VGQ12_08020 [Candidatus Angelobacter sp.]|jgi:hypothetical protein|nr:hypothetical protein [Candidatus Angelobacter sp.]
MTERQNRKQLIVENFNLKYPVGTRVLYRCGMRDGKPSEGKTCGLAEVMGGHTPVVFVEGVGAIALTHVEIVKE